LPRSVIDQANDLTTKGQQGKWILFALNALKIF
jgi:hypothetical protein